MGFTIVGGELRIPSIGISVEGALPVSAEQVESNIKNVDGLGLPTYRELQPAHTNLAAVGGGPSIEQYADEILNFDGDIWAINGAWKWLKDRGRDSVFLAVDPHPIVCKWAEGVERALLETRCDPQVFEMLKGKDVRTFDIGGAEGQIRCGSSAVTVTPHLACRLKYFSITLFGCESSYHIGGTHAYQNEMRPEQMLVMCGSDSFFLTSPDFYMQAVELRNYIAQIPVEFIKERSGGLLRAMIENKGEHHIVWISDAMAKTLQPVPVIEPAHV